MIFSEYSPSTWRLLKTPPERGAWNMAVDEAILEAVSEGKSPPTLRLFAWDPPCLSIGSIQIDCFAMAGSWSDELQEAVLSCTPMN